GVVIAAPFDSAKVAAHFFSLGYDYAEQSDYLVAAEMYRGGLKFDPNNAQARYQLGEALERLGDHQEEALAEYRIARELIPDSDTGPMALTRMVRLQQSIPPVASTAPGLVCRDCERCPEMVVLPAGLFVMGSPPGEKGRPCTEGPQPGVVIAAPFAVAKF